MNRRFSRICACLALLLCPLGAFGQVPVLGGDGVTLKDLVGSETYVTIRLKESNARDRNLRISKVYEDHLTVIALDGTETAYELSMIREIRIQKSRIIRDNRSGRGGGVLSSRDISIQERAEARAREIFAENQNDQSLGLRAAALLGAQGVLEAVDEFLKPRAENSNLDTAVLASKYLYLAGGEPEKDVISKGLLAANRDTVAAAAGLAGWTEYTEVKDSVRKLLNDSIAKISSNAARASGRLKDRDAIPDLIDTLRSLDKEKGDAAVFALSLLGGETVRSEMKDRVERSRRSERYRAMRVLLAMGDTEMVDALRPDNLREPIFAVDAAILLVRLGDWEATLDLRDRLQESTKTTADALDERARMSAGLFAGGYTEAKSTLQSLLQLSPADIFLGGKQSNVERKKKQVIKETQIALLKLIAETGERGLMAILRPAIENKDPEVALTACEAAIAIANPAYRKRLIQTYE